MESSDRDELGWSWACDDDERDKMMMQLKLQLRDELCGAYSTEYESAGKLVMAPPELCASASNRSKSTSSGGNMSHLIHEIKKQKAAGDHMGNWWSFTSGPSTANMCYTYTPQAQAQAQAQGQGWSSSSVEAMREMMFRMAAMQPIEIEPETVKAPKRRNVKISKDPQSAAARHRRERISHRIRILQRLVPGGTKMDTASMLDEAIHYLKFLKSHLNSLQSNTNTIILLAHPLSSNNSTPTSSNFLPLHNPPAPHPLMPYHVNSNTLI